MYNDQRNVVTNSQSSQPWQTSGVTELAYLSRTRLLLRIGKTPILMLERYCTESRLFQFPKDEAWRTLNQVFPYRTMDTIHGMVILTRYERHLPRIPLSDFDIKDVIRLLRGVAETTDNYATYNFKDTFENNLFKITFFLFQIIWKRPKRCGFR